MKVHYIALSSAGREIGHAPMFESDGMLREWLVAHAARSYCSQYLATKKTMPEAKAALAEAYEVAQTPNGLWWAAVQWAVEVGRGEWHMGVQETVRFDVHGAPMQSDAQVTYLDEAYAATVVP